MKNEKLIKYLKAGNAIAGGVVGGAISLIGGPAGALLGGGAGVVIEKGLSEFTDRYLAQRQVARLGAAAAFSLVKINERLEKGDVVRQDDFFSVKKGRSDAEELLEGVLLKSKDQYQERKIQYISNLYANTVFLESLSAENANSFLSIIDSLSYRKMCILSMYYREDEIESYGMRSHQYTSYQEPTDYEDTFELNMLLQDMKDLFDKFLIVHTKQAVIYKEDLTPNDLKISINGKEFVELMELEKIPRVDYEQIITLLK